MRLLLETGQPKAALTEFEKALAATPNRFRGNTVPRDPRLRRANTRAREYHEKLVALSATADGMRPRMEQARAYLRKPRPQAEAAPRAPLHWARPRA